MTSRLQPDLQSRKLTCDIADKLRFGGEELAPCLEKMLLCFALHERANE